MKAPVVTAGATPSLPYDGGIGYAVAKWTKDPKLSADLVRALTSTDALKAFYADAGAIAADTTIDVSAGGPAVATIVSEIENGKPALHVALGSKTLDLMGRLSQQLLSGSVTVDEAVKQLAASDQAG
jgi:multiple sugar transport system substrate-binding protein